MPAIKGDHMSTRFVAGSAAAIVAALYLASSLGAQAPAASPADLRNAAAAEVRTAEGQAVMRGDFTSVDEDDDDMERKAALKPADGGKGTGDAEVEFAKDQPKEQEVEFLGRDLTPGIEYSLLIDGHEVAKATADKRGRIEIEVNVPLPGASK